MLEEKIKPYLQDPFFIEDLELVRQNSKGKIWLMGGFLYKNLASFLYGGTAYNYDIDFIVEERNDALKEILGWKIETNSYGVQNYIREGHRMSFTDIKKVIRVSGLNNPSIEEIVDGTPLNVQAMAYSLDDQIIIGEKGIAALNSKIVKVNSRNEAEFYAERKGKKLVDIIIEKAKELNFDYELP